MKSRRQPRPSRAELEAELNRLRLQLDDRTGKLETDALQRSQNEIEASREHYIELYDLAPFGLITLDRTGIIRALNFTATELLGQRRGKLIGCPFVSILRPGTRRLFLNQLTKLRRGQPQSTAEVEVRRPGQPPIALQLALVIPSAGRGDGAWCQAALVDITERKRAEARMAVLARLGLSLSAAVDPVGAARAIVDAALEFFGWDACFLMVHDPATDTATHLICMDTINGQRVPVSGSTLDGPVSPLARRVMEEGPHLFLRRDAEDKRLLARRFGDTSRASLSLMYVPVRQEHRSIGVLSVQSYEPVAYNQEDLAILQGLANHAGGALARLNAEASLRRANERLEARVAERTAQLQEYRDHLEELVKARTGELEAANARLREEIVSREKAEQALLRSAEDLKRSNLDLEQFAYAITHDLQEPLRAVSGFVRLLEHRCPAKLDTKMREYIHGAAEGAQRMDQLITDLLAYSRVGYPGPADGGDRPGRAAQGRPAQPPVCHPGRQGQRDQRPPSDRGGRWGPNVTTVPEPAGQRHQVPQRGCARNPRWRAGGTRALGHFCARQRYWHRPAVFPAHIPGVPTAAHAHEISRHRHRAVHLQEDRRAAWRKDLGRIPAGAGLDVLLLDSGGLRVHPASTTKRRCPKSETRNPKPEGRPKSEIRTHRWSLAGYLMDALLGA